MDFTRRNGNFTDSPLVAEQEEYPKPTVKINLRYHMYENPKNLTTQLLFKTKLLQVKKLCPKRLASTAQITSTKGKMYELKICYAHRFQAILALHGFSQIF